MTFIFIFIGIVANIALIVIFDKFSEVFKKELREYRLSAVLSCFVILYGGYIGYDISNSFEREEVYDVFSDACRVLPEEALEGIYSCESYKEAIKLKTLQELQETIPAAKQGCKDVPEDEWSTEQHAFCSQFGISHV